MIENAQTLDRLPPGPRCETCGVWDGAHDSRWHELSERIVSLERRVEQLVAIVESMD